MAYICILEQEVRELPQNDNLRYLISVFPSKKQAQDGLTSMINQGMGLTGKIVELHLNEQELDPYWAKGLTAQERAQLLKSNANQKALQQSPSAQVNQPNEKSVLVLIGDMSLEAYERQYWDKMCDPQSHIKLTYCSIASFLKNGPPNAHYDSIIHSAHGYYVKQEAQSSGKLHRRDHRLVIVTDKKKFVKTDYLVQLSSYYTDNIAISACHAGAVMKDLRHKPVDANVLALGGSKHATIMYDFATPKVVKYLSLFGTNGLFEFASTFFVNTLTIQNKDKSITKLGAAKIADLDQSEPLTSLIRILSVPNYTEGQKEDKKEDSWWTVGEVIPVEVDQAFKNESLCIAVNKEKLADVLFWLKQGAFPNAKLSEVGRTPLTNAIYNENPQIVAALLDHGADPNLINHLEGRSPLTKAIDLQAIYVIEELLKGGENRLKADPNLPDGFGALPLSKAIASGSPDIVGLLINQGANPNLLDVNGKTPFSEALQSANEEILQLLINAVEKTSRESAAATPAVTTQTVPTQVATTQAIASPTDVVKTEPEENEAVERLINRFPANSCQQNFEEAVRLLKEKTKDSYSGSLFEKTKAYNKAQSLCVLLEKAGENYFQKKLTPSFALFSEQCSLHIQEARKTLDKHRGCKKILNILAIIFTGGLYGLVVLGELLVKKRCTFFATNTALKLNDIETNISYCS